MTRKKEFTWLNRKDSRISKERLVLTIKNRPKIILRSRRQNKKKSKSKKKKFFKCSNRRPKEGNYTSVMQEKIKSVLTP